MHALLWPIIIITTIIIEIITVSLVSIWFSIGALFAYIAYLFNCNMMIQLSLFIIISIVTIILLRPISYKMLRGNIVKTNQDALVGEIGQVMTDINLNSFGEVRIRNHIWNATSINHELIHDGEFVEILAIEGNHLIVRKVEEK